MVQFTCTIYYMREDLLFNRQLPHVLTSYHHISSHHASPCHLHLSFVLREAQRPYENSPDAQPAKSGQESRRGE